MKTKFKLIESFIFLLGFIIILITLGTSCVAQTTSVKQNDLSYSKIYDLAVVNIIETQTDKQKIGTIRFYCGILPIHYRLKLKLWASKVYPHLKIYKQNQK